MRARAPARARAAMDELTDPEQIDVDAGEPFAVLLTGDGAGGYLWRLAELPAELRLRREEVLAPGEPAPGATGARRFELVVAEPGSFTVRFELRRDWEAGAAAARTVVVRAGA